MKTNKKSPNRKRAVGGPIVWYRGHKSEYLSNEEGKIKLWGAAFSVLADGKPQQRACIDDERVVSFWL
jgi:hypothetical protein